MILDVRVAQVRCEIDLAAEALGTKRESHLGGQDLYRDFPLVLEVPGEVHRRHGSATELLLDLVPVGDGSAEAIERGRHA